MGDLSLSVFVLAASAVICFAALATLYGLNKAYIALCWVPVAAYGLVRLFAYLDYQAKPADENPDFLIEAVQLTSFIQGLVGFLLTIAARQRKQRWKLLLFAAVLATLPFLRA